VWIDLTLWVLMGLVAGAVFSWIATGRVGVRRLDIAVGVLGALAGGSCYVASRPIGGTVWSSGWGLGFAAVGTTMLLAMAHSMRRSFASGR
jgi:uncharacterized membrane protein YeaQ/YmgE (transglycosylase-associated protein family)